MHQFQRFHLISRKVGRGLLCLWLVTSAGGFAARAADVITDIATLRNLPPGPGRVGREVSLRAVVTYFNTNWPICFIQDQTAGSFVHMDFQKNHLVVGDLVQAEGVVNDDGLPKLLKFTVLRSGEALPEVIDHGIVRSAHRLPFADCG